MIELINVSKTYDGGRSYALDHVSFSIDAGEFVFIVGDSGAGKSTLFKLLIKELKPSEGDIIIDGKSIIKLRRRKIPYLRRKIGVVFQNYRLLQDRNVFDNIAFAQRVISVPRKKINKRVSEMLTLTGISNKYRSLPSELSGGEQQRVALARALVNNPKILLADEPTGNLDPTNAEAIMGILNKVNENGTTVVVVTHNYEFVRTMGKRIIRINNGAVSNDIREGGYSG